MGRGRARQPDHVHRRERRLAGRAQTQGQAPGPGRLRDGRATGRSRNQPWQHPGERRTGAQHGVRARRAGGTFPRRGADPGGGGLLRSADRDAVEGSARQCLGRLWLRRPGRARRGQRGDGAGGSAQGRLGARCGPGPQSSGRGRADPRRHPHGTWLCLVRRARDPGGESPQPAVHGVRDSPGLRHARDSDSAHRDGGRGGALRDQGARRIGSHPGGRRGRQCREGRGGCAPHRVTDDARARLPRAGIPAGIVTAAMAAPGGESLPREELERQTLEGMRRTLGHVLAYPAWRRRLAGAEPGDIRSAADWLRLPFLTKDELRGAYPFDLACVERERILRVHMSSGTTGNPVVNPYTRADLDQWATVMARCYAVAGVGARDVIQITASFGLFTGGFGFHYGAERIGAMVIPLGAGRTSLQLLTMRDLRATVLAGIATYPLRILEVAREEQFDLASLSLRVAILGAEMWSDDLRRRIERELHIATFDIFGMTETGGPGLGIDCEARDGIHVWEDHYFCEVVDPTTGAPRGDGEEGELVVSTLTREGLPLIRYRTHDLTRVLSRSRCACGRTHLRLDRIRGRTDDMIIFRGVNFFPRQIESLVLKQPGAGHEYQIILDRTPGGSDRLMLLIEARESFAESGLPRLRRDLKELLNLSPEITVLEEGELPRAAGKSQRVVDRR